MAFIRNVRIPVKCLLGSWGKRLQNCTLYHMYTTVRVRKYLLAGTNPRTNTIPFTAYTTYHGRTPQVFVHLLRPSVGLGSASWSGIKCLLLIFVTVELVYWSWQRFADHCLLRSKCTASCGSFVNTAHRATH